MDSGTKEQAVSSDHDGLEERQRVFAYCKKYLSGVWKQLNSHDEIEITRLCGGMTNLLYRCSLIQKEDAILKGSCDDPREVLLRLYGPSHGDIDIQLDIVSKLSNENLGPAMHSSFAEGRFEQFLPSHPLSWSEMTSDYISSSVAKKVASIHKLNIKCLDKHAGWLIKKFNELNDYIEQKIKTDLPLKFKPDTLDSTKEIAGDLLKIDFKQEIDYLEKLFEQSDSPLVFSHNDLHQNNILLLDQQHSTVQCFNNRIVLIDFEYCSYNYRPFDLANHLSEWCFDYTGSDYPNFSASLDRFPSEEKQRQFLRSYLETDESTSVDELLREMQPFFMASNFLWSIWAIRSACTSDIRFGYWEMAKWKWDIYRHCKSNFEI